MAYSKICGKFAVENNRLKQYILCLLPTVQLRLKTVYVPAHCAQYKPSSLAPQLTDGCSTAAGCKSAKPKNHNFVFTFVILFFTTSLSVSFPKYLQFLACSFSIALLSPVFRVVEFDHGCMICLMNLIEKALFVIKSI